MVPEVDTSHHSSFEAQKFLVKIFVFCDIWHADKYDEDELCSSVVVNMSFF